jgi:hypothetical protein
MVLQFSGIARRSSMFQFIQLESEKYWAPVQADRNRLLRQQQQADRNEQRVFWTVLLIGAVALAAATVGGAFGDVDVVGTLRQIAFEAGWQF